jgi:hypothetical protein
MKTFRVLAPLLNQHLREQNHEKLLVGKTKFGERTMTADVRASGDTKMEGGSPLLAQGHE